jgi:hypothetical protein
MVKVRSMPPKFVALIVAASLTTGWLLASLVSPPVAELQGLPERTSSRAPAGETIAEAPYTEQLHLKLQHAPVRPVPRRNPFVFGARERVAPAPSPAPSTDTTVPLVDIRVPPSPTGPSLRLAGIGSTTTEGGLVRTAVIGDGTTVHLVKVGETVSGYAVVEITDDTVTLANAAGAQWQLKLK